MHLRKTLVRCWANVASTIFIPSLMLKQKTFLKNKNTSKQPHRFLIRENGIDFVLKIDCAVCTLPNKPYALVDISGPNSRHPLNHLHTASMVLVVAGAPEEAHIDKSISFAW